MVWSPPCKLCSNSNPGGGVGGTWLPVPLCFSSARVSGSQQPETLTAPIVFSLQNWTTNRQRNRRPCPRRRSPRFPAAPRPVSPQQRPWACLPKPCPSTPGRSSFPRPSCGRPNPAAARTCYPRDSRPGPRPWTISRPSSDPNQVSTRGLKHASSIQWYLP